MKKWASIILIILFSSCDNDDDIVNRVDIESIVDNPDNQFIYFEDGNVQYYYPEVLFLNDLSNRYIEGSDQLNINMTDVNDQFHCNVHITNAGINSLQFPAEVGDINSGGVVFMELKEPGRPVEVVFGQNDDINYFGSNLNGLMLIIDSLEDNVITCSFEGSLMTRTGKKINVEKGQLRVKLQS